MLTSSPPNSASNFFPSTLLTPRSSTVNGWATPGALASTSFPIPAEVRESFKKFRASILAIDPDKNVQQYDNEPFTKYLQGYAPEIKQWWDAYGPSTYGSKSDDTSAYVAITELHDIVEDIKDDQRVTLPGGNGALSQVSTKP